ncbi:MAG: type VI secretion system baseplate subunit TssK [Planctomycetota bacterium]
MRYPRVHWSEGMFLRPHHFQAAERHRAEQLATSDRWSTPYNYGIRAIELSEEALSNYHVQITSLEARLPDGSLVSLQTGEELQRVDLKERFQKHSLVTVYLAAPKLVLGRANVAAQGEDEAAARFQAAFSETPDETSGGSDQELGFLRLSLRLLLTGDDLQGYEVLPLARVRRAGSEASAPKLDPDYVPPLVATDAWQPLGIDIVRAIYDIIGEKISVLAERAGKRGATFTSKDPGDLDDLLMLTRLNEAYARLNCMTFAHGIHPFWVYEDLCAIVGALSIFGPSRRVEDVPAYDHDDLARIFRWAYDRIRELLGSRQALPYFQRPFTGAGHGLQVTIEPEWLHAAYEWYVGVAPENVSETACRELLRPGKLNWKMGSSQQVEVIFKHGVPGIDTIELNDTPRALPPTGWVYYEVKRSGNAWKDVLDTQSLALRFKTELIGNLESLAGKERLEIVLPDRTAGMQFALFAVPMGDAGNR